MIDIQNLHVTFGAHTPLENKALRGLSLQVKEGEFVTVIGSNGAGKSTFLNALSGEVIATKGTISIDGVDVSKRETHHRADMVSRVFQNPLAGTCENLTIEENLALALKRGQKRRLFPAIQLRSRQLFRDKVKHLGLGLEDRLGDKMGLLSGGQRQAVSLLMATLTPSKILLLDEHTAALDPKTARFVLDITQKIVTEQKLTAIMVTHSMRQALDFGDRTLMLHKGQIAFDVGDPERQHLQVKDLLDLFEKNQGEVLSDDALLLSGK
jgi:putative ABC transport system ATP-binding protein